METGPGNLSATFMQTFGMCDVDLFATRLNTQLEKCVSWRLDSEVIGADALQLTWTDWMGVCFSPILSDWEVSQESKRGQGVAGTDSASVEVPALCWSF